MNPLFTCFKLSRGNRTVANLLLKQTPERPELGRAASRFVRPPSSFLPRVSGEMKRLVLDVGSELPPSGGRVRPDCEALAADWGRGDVAAVGAETPLRGGGLGGGVSTQTAVSVGVRATRRPSNRHNPLLSPWLELLGMLWDAVGDVKARNAGAVAPSPRLVPGFGVGSAGDQPRAGSTSLCALGLASAQP